MIFLKNLFKWFGLATLSLINYNMARGLLGRSCLKYFKIIKKNYPFPYPYRKKISKIPKIYFFICDDFFLNKTHTLILRSGKFGNLVTSFFLLGLKIASETNFYEFEVGRGRLAALGRELMI